ncbi:MAG TPA: hypothetical protein PLO14_05895 [Accumulibacter sp.]|uniref:hypothetical protein n=1 Tax=Accumulibacter sp. TaxID=2053492 RepID=UPI0025ED207F|nr:hypothetical protein [Accumulibacter sp.]MCM8600573.1 hypothetical protein [Accumulibacter sp.]MCM8664355.1 hypothetical protein [Accumulibacter sp.]HNC51756.1 hypothetical protein [Accumulibacter sp.]
MSDAPVQSAGVVRERRGDPRLRSAFDDAFAMIEPFFDLRQGWSGHSLEHLAYRIVRDNFPDLSVEDVHTVVVVAHRVYIERHPDDSDHLPRPEELRRIRL